MTRRGRLSRGSVLEALTHRMTCSDLAAAIGASTPYAASGAGLRAKCPYCGRARQFSVSVYQGVLRGRCYYCRRGGDAIRLLGDALGYTAASDLPRLLDHVATTYLGHICADDLEPPRVIVPRPPVAVRRRRYPDHDELAHVVQSLGVPLADFDATHPARFPYLRDRLHAPGINTHPQLANSFRVLRPAEDYPAWARFDDRPWPDAGFELGAIWRDKRGRPKSIRAIRTRGSSPPKRLSPTGKRSDGLVMMSPACITLVRDGVDAPGQCGRLMVVEGETDFAAAVSCIPADDPAPPGVMAIMHGSITEDLADAIPHATDVCLVPDPDTAGREMMGNLAKLLEARGVMVRVDEHDADVADRVARGDDVNPWQRGGLLHLALVR